MAAAIKCLADNLPDGITEATDVDVRGVEKIRQLASKIIGNGSPTASNFDGTMMMKLALVGDPVPQQASPKSENALDAEATACEADVLMQSIQLGSQATARPGTCSDPAGSKAE